MPIENLNELEAYLLTLGRQELGRASRFTEADEVWELREHLRTELIKLQTEITHIERTLYTARRQIR